MTNLTITPLILELASVFAQKRYEENAGRSKGADLGTPEANKQADKYGCLSELAVTLEVEAICNRLGLVVKSGFLHKGKADLQFTNRLVEIKSIPPGKRFACVNFKQYMEADRSTFYLFVLFAPDGKSLQVMHPVAWSKVGEWDYRTDGHSPYISTSIDNLRPLQSLETLCKRA